MITEIKIHSFGKFRDVSYPLGRLTVFSGPNEAGKTTIFDAFFDALCKPKASSRYGKPLQARYGSTRKVELKWDSEPYEINENDFVDLCSISALRDPPRFDAADGWMAQIRNQLFAGGINPALILGRLEAKATRKGSVKHNRELKELDERKNQLEKSLFELEQQRNDSLHALKLSKQEEIEIHALSSELDQVQNEKIHLEAVSAQYHALAERNNLRNWLIDLQRLNELHQKINSIKIPPEAEIDSLDKLKSSAEESGQELQLNQKLLLGLETDLSEEQTRMRKLQHEEFPVAQKSAAAESFKTRLNEIMLKISHGENKSTTGTGTLFRIPFILLSVAGICIGIGAIAVSSFFQHTTWQNFFFFGGISAAMISAGSLFFGMFRKRMQLSAFKQDFIALKKSFKELVQEAQISLSLDKLPTTHDIIHVQDLTQAGTSLVEALDAFKTDHMKLLQQLSTTEEQCRRMEERIREVKQHAEAASSEQKKLTVSLENMLFAYNAESIRDLENRIQASELAREQVVEITGRLNTAHNHFGTSSSEELQIEITRRLDSIDEQITQKDPGELERKKIQRNLAEHISKEQVLREKLELRRISCERNKTRYASRFSELPSRFLELEKELQQVNQKIEELLLQREAAESALEIIQDLQSDTGDQLRNLSEHVSDWFGDIIDTGRNIDFKGFSANLISIEDANGTHRSVEHLSSGTRDAFFLAARLAMLAESDLPDGIILLDDPCVYLDIERSRMAVDIIYRFLKITNHQILLFTKDSELASAVLSAGPDKEDQLRVQSHQLGRHD